MTVYGFNDVETARRLKGLAWEEKQFPSSTSIPDPYTRPQAFSKKIFLGRIIGEVGAAMEFGEGGLRLGSGTIQIYYRKEPALFPLLKPQTYKGTNAEGATIDKNLERTVYNFQVGVTYPVSNTIVMAAEDYRGDLYILPQEAGESDIAIGMVIETIDPMVLYSATTTGYGAVLGHKDNAVVLMKWENNGLVHVTPITKLRGLNGSPTPINASMSEPLVRMGIRRTITFGTEDIDCFQVLEPFDIRAIPGYLTTTADPVNEPGQILHKTNGSKSAYLAGKFCDNSTPS